MNLNVDQQGRVPRVVKVGTSRAPDAADAVAEAVAQIGTASICFLLVFVPDCLDHSKVADALNKQVPRIPAFGSTSAGQITPEGYEGNALLLVAFPREHFRFSSTLLHPLKPVSIERAAMQAKTLSERFRRTAGWHRFAITLADGMSKQEDTLVAAFEAGLDGVPLFGGSAAHGLAFDETYVLHGGTFHSNAALLMVIETDLAIEGVKFDHFMPTERQIVVTDARPDDRVVHEINGSPAAPEYARLVGRDLSDLSPQVFAENPVLVRNHGSWHVRAIQQVVEGDSLAFLSAIENGLVLTLGRGKEILKTLDMELSITGLTGEAPDFVLGFDCVLRRLEIEQNGIMSEASEILRNRRVLGFNTYGEQCGGIHMNQTFVGIAFFPPGREIEL